MARTRAGEPKNDVYTALLAVSLAAMLVASVLLYLDYSEYGSTQPDATVEVRVPEVTPATPGTPKADAGPLPGIAQPPALASAADAR